MQPANTAPITNGSAALEALAILSHLLKANAGAVHGHDSLHSLQKVS